MLQHSLNNNKLRERNKKLGLCRDCNKPIDKPSELRCEEHRIRNTESNQQRRLERQVLGLCERCDDKRITKNYCAFHAAENIAKVAKYRAKKRLEKCKSK